MFSMFKNVEEIRATLLVANVAAAGIAVYNWITNPEHATEHMLDLSVHIMNVFLLEDRVPHHAQNLGGFANICHVGAVVGSVINGTSSLSFAGNLVDTLLHAANAYAFIPQWYTEDSLGHKTPIETSDEKSLIGFNR